MFDGEAFTQSEVGWGCPLGLDRIEPALRWRVHGASARVLQPALLLSLGRCRRRSLGLLRPCTAQGYTLNSPRQRLSRRSASPSIFWWAPRDTALILWTSKGRGVLFVVRVVNFRRRWLLWVLGWGGLVG